MQGYSQSTAKAQWAHQHKGLVLPFYYKKDIIKVILLHKRKSQTRGLTCTRVEVQILEAKIDLMEDLETITCSAL